MNYREFFEGHFGGATAAEIAEDNDLTPATVASYVSEFLQTGWDDGIRLGEIDPPDPVPEDWDHGRSLGRYWASPPCPMPDRWHLFAALATVEILGAMGVE